MVIGSIEEGRETIARIDADIVRLISERTNAAEEIGRIKGEMGLPIKDKGAEERVMERFRTLAEQYGLPDDKMRSIALLLIETAICREESIQTKR